MTIIFGLLLRTVRPFASDRCADVVAEYAARKWGTPNLHTVRCAQQCRIGCTSIVSGASRSATEQVVCCCQCRSSSACASSGGVLRRWRRERAATSTAPCRSAACVETVLKRADESQEVGGWSGVFGFLV
eukprot:1748235-Pleurochrysis_carterae.AAC.2